MTAMVLLSSWMASQVEYWIPAKKFTGYDVSSFGRIRSHKRGAPRILRTVSRRQMEKNEYLTVSLATDSGIKSVHVHTLIAEAFVCGYDKGKEVNHRTGAKFDCRDGNLKYVTRSINHQHAMRHGLQGALAKKLTETDVVLIRLGAEDGVSDRVLAARFGVGLCTIASVKKRQTWRHIE